MKAFLFIALSLLVLILSDAFGQLGQSNRVISSPSSIELSPATKTISKKDLNIESNYVLKLEDSAGGEYVGIKSPSTVSPSWILTLPTVDGNSGQLLSTDGSGVTSWIDVPSSFINNASSGQVIISQGAGSGSGEANLTYDFGTNNLALDGQFNIKAQNELRLEDTTGGQYVGFKAAGTATSTTYTMPASDGSSNQILKTNGSATLSWTSFLEIQSYSISQTQSSMTDRSNELQFNLGTASIANVGTALLTASDDSANTRTKFTSNFNDVDLTIHCSSSSVDAAGNQRLVLIHNGGTDAQHGSTAAADTQSAIVSTSIRLASGDYITFKADSALNNDAGVAKCRFMALRIVP